MKTSCTDIRNAVPYSTRIWLAAGGRTVQCSVLALPAAAVHQKIQMQHFIQISRVSRRDLGDLVRSSGRR